MTNRVNDREAFMQWIDSIGQKEIADAIGVKKAAVWNWRHGLNQPTPEHARKLAELAAGVLNLEDIRPDIYGDAHE